MIDRVLDGYNRLRQHPRLGSQDRTRLESHVDYLWDIEQRLATSAPMTAQCASPNVQGSTTDWEVLIRDHIQTVVAAVKCDVSRVITLMLCPDTDTRVFSSLGVQGDHHALSHERNDDVITSLTRINRWYAERVAELITELNVVEEETTGRTFLDNSIVLWGNEFGMNQWHEASGAPALLFGSGGGAFHPGRYLDFRRRDANGSFLKRLYLYNGNPTGKPDDREYRGVPYNALMVAILNAMGLTEYAGTGWGNYHEAENYLDQYDLAAARSPLPHL